MAEPMGDTWRAAIKRGFDVTIAGAGLVISAPALCGIAALIKWYDSGPVFFTQERVGRHGRPFHIIKFRTMVAGAEALGPQVTAGGDPRVTPIGRWLRRTKLDELPQLLNVVGGSMSLVGPRPEVRKYVEMYRAAYDEILRVRPGITDEASIAFRHEESLLANAKDAAREYAEVILPRKIELSLDYVRSRSIRRDLLILAKTLRAVIRKDVADHEQQHARDTVRAT